jgi:hypothetical protein
MKKWLIGLLGLLALGTAFVSGAKLSEWDRKLPDSERVKEENTLQEELRQIQADRKDPTIAIVIAMFIGLLIAALFLPDFFKTL